MLAMRSVPAGQSALSLTSFSGRKQFHRNNKLRITRISPGNEFSSLNVETVMFFNAETAMFFSFRGALNQPICFPNQSIIGRGRRWNFR
jgi:hypothetical protein